MQDAEIFIRDYGPSDLDALINVFRDSVRKIASCDYTQEQVRAWAPDEIDREAQRIQHSGKRTWVAEIGAVVVGFSDLEPDGHLDCIYVHPDYQERGVATALLRHVEETARAIGLSRLYSEVSITAKPFFARRGFKVIAPEIVSRRGQEFLRYRMEKFLESE